MELTRKTYLIDGNGARAAKTVSGILKEGYLFSGGLGPVAQVGPTGAVTATFAYGLHANVPDVMVKAGVSYRLILDHLGSVRLVVNASSGVVVQRMDYDPWGVVLTDTNPGFQPFGFAGGLYDRDTNLVRFGARDYDPSVGRWTTKDASRFGGGLNFYAYAENDPVNFVDPRGRTPAAAAVAGGVLASAALTLAAGAALLDCAFNGCKEVHAAVDAAASALHFGDQSCPIDKSVPANDDDKEKDCKEGADMAKAICLRSKALEVCTEVWGRVYARCMGMPFVPSPDIH